MEIEVIKLILVARWSKGITVKAQQILLAVCTLIAMRHRTDMLTSRIFSHLRMILTYLTILTNPRSLSRAAVLKPLTIEALSSSLTWCQKPSAINNPEIKGRSGMAGI